jgi:hypothetical protein
VEPSRSFVLTPSMAGAGRQPPPQNNRPSFVFVPAVALTLLVALFAVDLTTSMSGSGSDESATGSQAMVAKDARSNAESAGGAGAAADQQRSTFSAQGTPVPPTASSQPQLQSAPSTGAPESGAIGPTVAPAATGASSGGQPVPPPVPPPSTGGPVTAPSGGLSSGAEPLGNAAANTFKNADGDDARDSGAVQGSSDGADWLRVAEIVAGIVLVVSCLVVFGPGLIKKGH